MPTLSPHTPSFGVGLRPCHYTDFLESSPKVDFVEIISENYMLPGGKSKDTVMAIRERYTVIPHGVSLSIGSSDSIDWDYLSALKKLVDRLDPPWFSDHMCWSRHQGHYMHNLLPLPYTLPIATFIAEKVRIIQDFMERPLILENVSSYVEYSDSVMTEWEFLSEIVTQSGCGLLLDINNVYVSAINHSFDPMAYLHGIPSDYVKQHHIAGHKDKGSFLLDTHDHNVPDPVWDLYRQSIPLFGPTPVILERDDDIPTLAELVRELDIARQIYNETTV
jgi:uncharacterized protein (UPF0276 family)